LTPEEEVYSWGLNNDGQLGNGSIDWNDKNFQSLPKKVEGFSKGKVTAISCGEYYSMALTENGRVYSWGVKFFGTIRTSGKRYFILYF
jgi:alpha-tubulin suppressor-like RCC1 family protein